MMTAMMVGDRDLECVNKRRVRRRWWVDTVRATLHHITESLSRGITSDDWQPQQHNTLQYEVTGGADMTGYRHNTPRQVVNPVGIDTLSCTGAAVILRDKLRIRYAPGMTIDPYTSLQVGPGQDCRKEPQS